MKRAVARAEGAFPGVGKSAAVAVDAYKEWQKTSSSPSSPPPPDIESIRTKK